MKGWEIIHDSDDEDGSPMCWARQIDSPKWGKYAWISKTDIGYEVEVDRGGLYGIKTIEFCKTLVGAKRWVSKFLT